MAYGKGWAVMQYRNRHTGSDERRDTNHGIRHRQTEREK